MTPYEDKLDAFLAELDGVVDVLEDIHKGLDYFRRLRAKHGRRESTDDYLRRDAA